MISRYCRLAAALALAFMLAGCTKSAPKPRLTAVYGSNDHALKEPGYAGAMIGLEIVSSTNCADSATGAEFVLTVTNFYPHTVVLTGEQRLDLRLTEYPGKYESWQHTTHLWSESPDYPADLAAPLRPGEERVYRWHWRPEPAERDRHDQTERDPSAQTPPPSRRLKLSAAALVHPVPGELRLAHTSAEIELFAEAIPWVVGGYAGEVDVPCAEVLQHTAQLDATATAEAKK